MSNLFCDKGPRGEHVVTLKMNELYKIFRDRLEYIRDGFDPDAVTQQACVEIEKKMGIFPNIGDATTIPAEG